ncbi:MAG: hypothetical protein ACK47M_22210 [Caldilinea sp.]
MNSHDPVDARYKQTPAFPSSTRIRPQVRQRLLRIAPTDVAISEIVRYELAYDTLIVAHARSLNVTLVTHNTREFGRVDGLRIENWALDVGEGAQP